MFGERELEEAFIEGMAFLQKYPLESVGGIEKVLQTAYDLASQRAASAAVQKGNSNAGGIGARLRDTVWKGFSSNLESHPEEEDYTSEEETSDEYESEKPTSAQQGAPSTLTSRLANTVWRGITNQSAMDAPSPSPSPSPRTTPLPSPLPSPLPASQSTPTMPPREAVANAAARAKSMFWGYAEKINESDAAANLAKVTTNWRVKALDAWSKGGNKAAPSNLSPPPTSQSAPSISSTQDHSRSISLTAIQTLSRPADDKRGSMPIIDRSDAYSPPPRPAFFRPVRDSMFVASPISRSGEASPVSDSGSTGGHGLRASLSGFKLPENVPSRGSSGPRPLLLNSTSLMTASPARSPVSPSADARWAESVRAKRSSVDHRASQSSISSLSPSEPYRPRRVDTRSDLDSDGGGSRIVPINRNKSPSPMARASRRMSSRHSASPPTPPTAHRRLPTESSAPEDHTRNGWGRADAPDSPTTIPSPPLPGTPDAMTTTINTDVRVKQAERQRGSVVLSESGGDVTFASPTEHKLSRRTATISRMSRDAEASDSSATEPNAKNPNLRRKRFPPRLQSLRNSRHSTEPMPPLPTLDVPEEHDYEGATTPRAGSFDEQMAMPSSPRRRTRKISGEGESTPGRTRKISTEGRTRKISSEGRRKVSAERDTKHKRESAAVEGDDEGYNELLSAYESEDQ